MEINIHNIKKLSLYKTILKYSPIKFKYDLIAGLSVAAISLPQNMAYALIVGVEPVYGIYATIMSMILFTFVGSSNYMIVGPTNIMAMALLGSLNNIGQGNYLEALFLVTFLVGVCQLLFGILKLGRFVNYISHSLIVGLSTGAVIMIGVGQLQNFMGLSVEGGSTIYTKIYAVLANLYQLNWTTFSLGLFTLFIILIIKRLKPRWPNYLIALIISTLLVYFFNLEDKITIIGQLPSGIIEFSLVNFDLSLIKILFSKALSIAILGLIQTLAVTKSIAVETDEEVNANAEFIGQGLINMIGPYFNSFATAGSFAKSFANIQAGAQTKFAQLMAGLSVVIVVLAFKPVITYVPIVGLASLVIVVAFSSIKVPEIKKNLVTTRGDAIIFTVTFLATLLLPSIETAIYIGLIVSLAVILKKSEDINLSVLKYEGGENDRITQQEVAELNEDHVRDKCVVLNIRGNLHFNCVDNFKEKLSICYRNGDTFIIRLREIERMDITIIKELDNFITKVQEADGKVYLSGVNEVQYKRLEKYGIIDKIKKKNVFISKEKLFSATSDAYHDVMDGNV